MAKAKTRKTTELQRNILSQMIGVCLATDAQVTEYAASKTARIVHVWHEVFTTTPRSDIVGALHPDDAPERNTYPAKILTNARQVFKLFEADPAAYRAVFVESGKRWDLRIDDVRERLAVRASVAAESAIIGEEIARQLAQNPADPVGATERAQPAIAQRIAVLQEQRAAVESVKAAKAAKAANAKFDPVAAAEVFAEKCVADADRGLAWLAEYAATLADIVADLSARRERGEVPAAREVETIEA